MYTDVLTKLKNSQSAKREMIKIPFSSMDMAILEVLEKHHYITEAAKKGRLPKRMIEVRLAYNEGKGAIDGVRFLSKPSRHLYAGHKALKSHSRSHGLTLISTSQGIMTADEARKAKMGGELLFEIW